MKKNKKGNSLVLSLFTSIVLSIVVFCVSKANSYNNIETKGQPVPSLYTASPSEVSNFLFDNTIYLLQNLEKALERIKIIWTNEKDSLEYFLKQASINACQIFALIYQISPFDSFDMSKLKDPKKWMTLDQLVEQLGSDKKAKYEELQRRSVNFMNKILNAQDASEAIDLLIKYEKALSAATSELKNSSGHAKLNFAFMRLKSRLSALADPSGALENVSLRDLATVLKSQLAGNTELGRKVNSFFKETEKIRKQSANLLGTIKEFLYKGMGVPVKDIDVALQIVNDKIMFHSKVFEKLEEDIGSLG